MRNKNSISTVIFLLVLLVVVWFVFGRNKPQQSVTLTQTPTIGQRTKTSGCEINGPMPDSACTPGDIIESATVDQICTPGYSKQVRNVPVSVKHEAFGEYGISHHEPGEYEVDHLISLELGGSNDIANLWPEAAEPQPGFHEKDKVENYLHKEVCNGSISLKEAQQKIATDWLTVYKKMPRR